MSSVNPKLMYLRALTIRAERLKRLTELRAPAVIISNEMMLVFRAAFAAFPKEMSDAFGDWVAKKTRSQFGMCENEDCGKPLDLELGVTLRCYGALCPDCKKAAEPTPEEKAGGRRKNENTL